MGNDLLYSSFVHSMGMCVCVSVYECVCVLGVRVCVILSMGHVFMT